MVNRGLVVAVVISVVIFISLVFVVNMASDSITGSVVKEQVVEEEYFKISDVEIDVNKTEDINGTKNISEPK